jgi:hypothetical protein
VVLSPPPLVLLVVVGLVVVELVGLVVVLLVVLEPPAVPEPLPAAPVDPVGGGVLVSSPPQYNRPVDTTSNAPNQKGVALFIMISVPKVLRWSLGGRRSPPCRRLSGGPSPKVINSDAT